MLKRILAVAVVAAAIAAPADAACSFQNTVPVKSLTGAFDAWKAVAGAMAECGDLSPELDQEFADKLPQALAAKPALYQIAGVANDSIVGVLDAGTIRPLDALVAKYGQDLSPNQLIKLNGHVYVIGMDVNDQSLMYRADIFKQLNIAVPTTWDEVLSAAAKIKQAGVVQYPIGATMKVGFNLAEEFVNMYLGFGGDLFGPGNAPAVNSPAGVKALDMMKRLTVYMDPNYLAADSTVVQKQFQQGKIAMSNLWASRGGAMDDPKESTVVGKIDSAPAPLAMPGGKPATTLWWDGAAIATNATDEQAEAAFRVIVGGMNPQMVAAHNNDVIWLADRLRADAGRRRARSPRAAGGAPAYPVSTTAMGAGCITAARRQHRRLPDRQAVGRTGARGDGRGLP